MQVFGESAAKASIKVLFAKSCKLNTIRDRYRFPDHSPKSRMSQLYIGFYRSSLASRAFKTTLVKSVFFGRKSELVTGVADVAFGEREDLGWLDREHENRI